MVESDSCIDEFSLTKGGTLPMYTSPSTLEGKIEEYFKDGCLHKWTATTVNENGEKVTQELSEPRPTIAGLARFLGFASRQSIYDYTNPNKRHRLAYTIKKGLLWIDERPEANLYNDKCTGSIFHSKHRGMTENKPVKDDNPFKLPFGKASVK